MNLEGYGGRQGDSLIRFFGERGGGVSGTESMKRVPNVDKYVGVVLWLVIGIDYKSWDRTCHGHLGVFTWCAMLGLWRERAPINTCKKNPHCYASISYDNTSTDHWVPLMMMMIWGQDTFLSTFLLTFPCE